MKLDFEKYADGLVPAIVQDAETQKVLMLGFMNAEAFEITQEIGKGYIFFADAPKNLDERRNERKFSRTERNFARLR